MITKEWLAEEIADHERLIEGALLRSLKAKELYREAKKEKDGAFEELKMLQAARNELVFELNFKKKQEGEV